MVRNDDQDTTKVALFIDWDNLAISTSADMGGALPDVPALVGTAQRYGEVVVARGLFRMANDQRTLGCI